MKASPHCYVTDGVFEMILDIAHTGIHICMPVIDQPCTNLLCTEFPSEYSLDDDLLEI